MCQFMEMKDVFWRKLAWFLCKEAQTSAVHFFGRKMKNRDSFKTIWSFIPKLSGLTNNGISVILAHFWSYFLSNSRIGISCFFCKTNCTCFPIISNIPLFPIGKRFFYFFFCNSFYLFIFLCFIIIQIKNCIG